MIFYALRLLSLSSEYLTKYTEVSNNKEKL
jgi:hypothetical protein